MLSKNFKKDIIDERITLDTVNTNEETKTVCAFFDIEKSMFRELFPDKYKEAVMGDLSLEFPVGHPEVECCTIEISPVEVIDDAYESTDWTSLSIPDNEIEQLLALALKGGTDVYEEDQ